MPKLLAAKVSEAYRSCLAGHASLGTTQDQNARHMEFAAKRRVISP